jgi:small-conductance mechanosensitive channel
VSAEVHSADPQKAIFAENLRQSSIKVVRLAFDFARAQAALPAAQAATSTSESARVGNLAKLAAAADERAEREQAQIDQINRQLPNASGSSRTRLLALREEVASEEKFARARGEALRALSGLMRAADEEGLGGKIAAMERSVPELADSQAKTLPLPDPNVPKVGSQSLHLESQGIVGLTTELFSTVRRMGQLDQLVRDTDTLRTVCNQLASPLRKEFRQVIGHGNDIAEAPESSDPATLQKQRKEMETSISRLKQVLAFSSPLFEQSAQIGASRLRILEWRGNLSKDYGTILRQLVLRLGMLTLELLVIWALSKLWHRGTMRYIQEARRRRQILVLRRMVVGFLYALVIVLSFVTDFGSLATFAGFSAAGLAVAMQSVILSIVAYFFLVGRWGVRVGDRVTISGVTGEVADVGLFRLYLMELGGQGVDLRPTGRAVVFPNSVFFQPSAIFKQAPGFEYVWRAVTLKIAGTDHAPAEKRLLTAVESIYGQYRDVLERQHKEAQSSLDFQTVVPHPESRLRFIDSGAEITIRYPVEMRRAAEIEDLVTRQIFREVENDPHLTIVGDPDKAEMAAR